VQAIEEDDERLSGWGSTLLRGMEFDKRLWLQETNVHRYLFRVSMSLALTNPNLVHTETQSTPLVERRTFLSLLGIPSFLALSVCRSVCLSVCPHVVSLRLSACLSVCVLRSVAFFWVSRSFVLCLSVFVGQLTTDVRPIYPLLEREGQGLGLEGQELGLRVG
jgi:hypothetical protein